MIVPAEPEVSVARLLCFENFPLARRSPQHELPYRLFAFCIDHSLPDAFPRRLQVKPTGQPDEFNLATCGQSTRDARLHVPGHACATACRVHAAACHVGSAVAVRSVRRACRRTPVPPLHSRLRPRRLRRRSLWCCPAGTSIRVRLDSDLGSKISQPGDSFTATVADDVLKGGDVIIARGARARGAVVDAKPLGKFKGGAVLEIKLDSVRSRWGSYPVETASISRAEQGKGKRFYRVDWWRRRVRRDRRRPRRWRQRRCNRRPGRRRSRHRWFRIHRQQADCAPAETLLTFKLDHAVHITMTNAQDQPALQTR